MKTPTTLFGALALVTALAACGGGGGGGGSTAGGGGVVPPTASPTPSPTPPATTNASGKLVDDASNTPLAGVNVKIEPWTSLATPLPAPQTTTAADGSFTLANVPNGHYLLVIGSDSSGDTTRPTIHDNVSLTGGNQTLKAPLLPAIPLITPAPAEQGGVYRLTTLDPVAEVPCFTAFNAQRAARSLPLVVEDEWLTENARAIVVMHQNPAYVPGMTAPGNPFGILTTGNTFSGGLSCAKDNIAFAFGSAGFLYPVNPATQWFGGNFFAYNGGSTSAFSLTEFPVDPRTTVDPNVPIWP